jgi:tetratricopeptide (TPR) repeat protein
LLAATLNQGDPSARLCAAHAHIALGDYGPALRLIERAMALEPRIVFLPLDLRGAYGERDDFVRQVRALQQAAEQEPEDGELWFLLGYCRYFAGQIKESVAPFSKAAELMSDHRMVVRLSELAKTVAGKAEKKPSARP